MFYCPNCSAKLDNPEIPICPKCGFDRIQAGLEEKRFRKERGLPEPEMEKVNEPVRGDDGEVTVNKCPLCNAGLKHSMDSKISFDLMGKEVTIHDIRIMGMNLRKKAITQCIISFDGWVCTNNHRFFTKFTGTYKELCPVCREPMKRFGAQVRSCSRCKINIPGDDYLRLDAKELLEEEGWIYKPNLI